MDLVTAMDLTTATGTGTSTGHGYGHPDHPGTRVVLAALAGTVLAAIGTTVGHASLPPYGGGPAGTHITVRVIATGGVPGWQITLIAATAAILAAATAVLLDRATSPGGTPQRQPP